MEGLRQCSRHQTRLLDGIRQFYAEGCLCDVTLVVGDREFPCNRIVLAASSPYFRAMFTSDVKESKDSHIPIHGIDADTLKVVLDYMYTGDLDITGQTVQSIFTASNFLDMEDLMESSISYITDAINVTNCLEVYVFAQHNMCKQLCESAFSFMLKTFTEVSVNEDFLSQVDVDLLEKFLQSDGLNVGKEEDLFGYIVKWVSFNEEDRKSSFCRLFKQLRLTLIDPSYLKETVKSNGYIKSNPFCTSLIASAKIYQIQSRINGLETSADDFTETFGLINPKPRLGMFNRKLLVFSGGASSADDRALTAFDPGTRKNYCGIKPHPSFDFKFKMENYCLVCTQENSLYFLGGIFYDNYHFQGTGDACREVFKYDQKESKWVEVKAMTSKRCSFSACANGNDILVTGGKSSYPKGEALDSLEIYDSEYDFWTIMEPMPFSLYKHASGVFAHALYVFGGKDVLDECIDSVCRYDIKGNTWSVVRTHLLKPRADHLALTVNNQVIIIGGGSKVGNVTEVEIYDPVTNRWRYGTDFPDERKIVNAVENNGNILVCGGVREFHRQNKPVRRVESKDLYEYDVTRNTWSKTVRMVQYANLQACVMAVLNTTFLNESDFISTSEVVEESEGGAEQS